MKDEEYYRPSPPKIDMSPHTEEGRANLRADNARLLAEQIESDNRWKLPYERGDPPMSLADCPEPDHLIQLQDFFKYDPETGLLHRRYVQEDHKDRVATTFAGLQGYGRVRFYGLTTASANMVWLLHHGRWPAGRIKRRDNDARNDRIENLFEGRPDHAHAIPFGGAKRVRANQSRGVARSGPDHWQAYYRVDGKQHNLGRFKTEAEAVAARQQWERGEDLV